MVITRTSIRVCVTLFLCLYTHVCVCVWWGGVIVAHNGQKGMLGFVEVGICQLPDVGAQTGPLVIAGSAFNHAVHHFSPITTYCFIYFWVFTIGFSVLRSWLS